MPTNTAAREAATIESMHTGDYTAPDLEYTPIPDPLPRLVRREELDAARSERDSLGIECALLRAERDQLRADNARLRAELNAWNAIPAEELIAYWNAFGNDNDIIGDWVGELRNGINVGRYYAGLEPL